MRHTFLTSPTHARWLEAEGDRLLEFGRASRHPESGFAWLDDNGAPELDRPVELWITCRMTHICSLGHLIGRPGCDELADHGVEALGGRFGGRTRRDAYRYGGQALRGLNRRGHSRAGAIRWSTSATYSGQSAVPGSAG